MKISGGLILLTLAGFVSARVIEYRCNEPCIPLFNCPSLSEDLDKSRNRTWIYSQEYEKIKAHYCYFKEEVHYVCCPRRMININRSYPDTTYKISTEIKTDFWKSSTYISIRPEVIKNPITEDPFVDCGRTFNRNYQAGYNTELSDFPWLALLEFNTHDGKKKLGCGGVLITDQHVLTAAHCVTSPSHNLSSVMLGKYDTDATTHCLPDSNLGVIKCSTLSQKVKPNKVMMHEDYHDGVEIRNGDKSYDIAVIKLQDKVKFSPYVKPICLPLGKPNVDTYLVSGWGRSMIPEALGFDQKFMSRLTRVDEKTCQANQFLPFVTDEHICAGTSSLSEHPCIGDSGGPLMGYELKPDGVVRMTVFGISFMDVTCKRSETTDLPGVFTSLFNYLPWIRKKLKV